MSEYTPTTNKIREAYIGSQHDCMGIERAESEADFDRWLAAHDAEVRKSVDPEMAMPCADTKPHSAHVWQMSATGFCLCAGVVTEEPEWEYGWRDERPFRWASGTNLPSSFPKTVYPYESRPGLTRVRRRKAGPWEPVEN